MAVDPIYKGAAYQFGGGGSAAFSETITNVNLYKKMDSLEDRNDDSFVHSRIGKAEEQFILPEPTSLIVVEYTSINPNHFPTRDRRTYGTLSITVDGVTATVPAGIRVQGSSSAGNPEKNWNLYFYGSVDAVDHYDGKKWIKIGKSPNARKLMFKSEFTETSKARNAASFELWDRIVKSRDTFPRYEVDNAWLGDHTITVGMTYGARGFPYYRPAVFYYDGEFYGIGHLCDTKDWYNYNLPEEDVEGLGTLARIDSGSGGPKGWLEVYDEMKAGLMDDTMPSNTALELRVPDTDWGAPRKQALLDLFAFIIDSSDGDFVSQFEQHFDKTNVIDLLILIEAIADRDGMHEIMLLSYDQQKWYMLPWDKDTTFGMNFIGTGISVDPDYELFTVENRSLPWMRITSLMKGDVDARYAELRDKGVLSRNNMLDILTKDGIMFTESLRNLDLDKWGQGAPNARQTSQDFGSHGQIMDWFGARLDWLDAKYNYTP